MTKTGVDPERHRVPGDLQIDYNDRELITGLLGFVRVCINEGAVFSKDDLIGHLADDLVHSSDLSEKEVDYLKNDFDTAEMIIGEKLDLLAIQFGHGPGYTQDLMEPDDG